jgi:uncharacterized protein
MVAVRLYHYYRQGVCACPIYISMAINTFKVLVSLQPRYFLNMSKSTVCKICLVVATNLVLISYPMMAQSQNYPNLATPNNSSLTQTAGKPSTESADPIVDDVVLNRVDKLKQFLNKGGSPDRYFHTAINANAIDCVKMMISCGANVNLPGDEGVTPLMTSARVTYRGTIDITKLLIKKGAKVNARASRGSTALMYASSGVATHYENEYVRVVRLLIRNGAKVNIKNQMGTTPLSIAREGKWQKIVATLQKAGAKP